MMKNGAPKSNDWIHAVSVPQKFIRDVGRIAAGKDGVDKEALIAEILDALKGKIEQRIEWEEDRIARAEEAAIGEDD